MKTTIAVFLTIETDQEQCGDALNLVDDLIDAGLFQDSINDALGHGERVTCAVVRGIPQSLLEQYDAADPGSSDGCG